MLWELFALVFALNGVSKSSYRYSHVFSCHFNLCMFFLRDTSGTIHDLLQFVICAVIELNIEPKLTEYRILKTRVSVILSRNSVLPAM
jgi:hypothetical protein